MGWDRLPVEILDTIASQLNRNDLFRLLLTCRHLREVIEPHLWRKVCIDGETACSSVRGAIRARPSLAPAVTELELFVTLDNAAERWNDGMYSDLALAASLPKLRRLAVHSACDERDKDRSRKAFRELLELRHLESCDLHWAHDNGDAWGVDDMQACFRLIYHPSMRRVCLRAFTSRNGGVGEPTDLERNTPLEKLSLLNCDIHRDDLAQLLDRLTPRDLQILNWSAWESFVVRVDLADAWDFIRAIEGSRGRKKTLERLTFFRDYERREELPLRFDGLESLKYLCTDIRTLIGEIPDSDDDEGTGDEAEPYPDPRGKPIDLSLPHGLEVLDLLCAECPQLHDPFIWATEIEPFFGNLDAYRTRTGHRLQELGICLPSWAMPEEPTKQALQKLAARCEVKLVLRDLPEDYERKYLTHS